MKKKRFAHMLTYISTITITFSLCPLPFFFERWFFLYNNFFLFTFWIWINFKWIRLVTHLERYLYHTNTHLWWNSITHFWTHHLAFLTSRLDTFVSINTSFSGLFSKFVKHLWWWNVWNFGFHYWYRELIYR